MSEANQPKTDATTEPEIGFTWWEIYGILNITLGNGFLAFGMNLPLAAKAIAIAINTAIAIGILLNNRISFLAATALSFNPLIWLINGIYLKNRWNHPRVNPHKNPKLQNSTIKQKWWQADQNFRLTALACSLWIVGAFFMQDRYYIDFRIVFFPPALLLIGYIGYQRLVVPPKQKTSPKIQHPHENPNPNTQHSIQVQETHVHSGHKTPAERSRSLDELIERMKK